MHVPSRQSRAPVAFRRRVATWLLLGVIALSGAPLEAGARVPSCWRGGHAGELAPGCCGQQAAARRSAARSCCERTVPMVPHGPGVAPSGCTCRLVPDGAPPAPVPHITDETVPARAAPAAACPQPGPSCAPRSTPVRVRSPRARPGPELFGAAARRLARRSLERWLAELSQLLR